MGGKTKQNQRTKNNAKPSNSGRSAELLGASVPSFVGFSTHTDLGMIPFVPGFSTAENLPETFDSSINTQYQLVLRKMSKKDPITKVKALQEFTELLTESDVDVVKGILPLWPKFYHNLANDVDHRVRESAQHVQILIATKCGKAVAPYIKQLAPVWLASQFDNYPPAASAASASFQSIFVDSKIREVCLFCQQEIMDFLVRNLTFHTASTLGNAKSCTPEEAEYKYQRVVASSLNVLSFFLEKTAGGDISSNYEKIQNLISNQKFWSFAKHRTPNIRAAWFKLFYNVLQYIPQLTKEIKGQLIPICFQNIDDSDPMIVSHVWGCVLQLQIVYDDWYKSINFKKNVQIRLSTFLQNVCNGNTKTVCPNLLLFISKITQESLQDVPLYEFHKDLLHDLRDAITSSKFKSKSDYLSLTTAYYECLLFILRRLNAINIQPGGDPSQLPQYILDEFIIQLIKWACNSQNDAVMYIFLRTSAVVAYWADHSEFEFYAQLLHGFWSSFREYVEKTPLSDSFLDRTIEFINFLYLANPTLKIKKVMFSTTDDEDTTDVDGPSDTKPLRSYIRTDLRKLVVLLVRLCLRCVSEEQTLLYESQIRDLTKLYRDAEFYAEISGDGDMEITLNLLSDLLRGKSVQPSEIVVEIVFEILDYMEKDKKLEFINKLLETKKPALQQCLIQRILSYPMCVEPEVRVMLAQDYIIEIILRTANEILIENSNEKFNLLHKCFFQTDSGEILINQKTVNGILEIISKPLTNPEEYSSMMDACGSFIAQIMPVVCSKNSTEKVQKDMFLKLLQFTIAQKKGDDLSEDTLWELTTCWQDALSSGDIVIDDGLLHKCAEIISNRVSKDMTPSEIEDVADIMSKFILCSTENIEDEVKRHERIDSISEVIFKPANENFESTYNSVANLCAFLDVVHRALAVYQLPEDAGRDTDFDMFFRRSLLNLNAGMRMVCNKNTNRILPNIEKTIDDEERTEDYCDPNETLLKNWTEKMYELTLQLVKIAAIAETLVATSSKVTKDRVAIMLEISEKIKLLLRSVDKEHVQEIKNRLLKDAAFNDVAATRAIQYLTDIPQYSQYQENALILVLEDLTDYFINTKSLSAYVNLLQFFLPKLTPKVINSDNPILIRDAEVWQKCVTFRCLIQNNFNAKTNDIADKKIITQALSFITEVAENQKQSNMEKRLYNTDVSKQDYKTVTMVVEYINLLSDVLMRFPYELTIKHWDVIRIGLSAWVLSVSKSVENFKISRVSIFITSVYNLYMMLARFIQSEKLKSSTEVISKMMDEWEHLFSPEVNVVLFKSFYNFVSLNADDYSTCYAEVINEVADSIRCLDFGNIYKSCKNGQKINLDDLVNFLLDNISSPIYHLRIISADVLNQLTPFFIATDKEIFDKSIETVESGVRENWPYINKFKAHMEKYETKILKYLDEFSFKLTELPEMKPIDRADALSYLFLWDCILNLCAKAPVELRSVYTSWLTENKFDQKFIHFLFRAMPVEILKNHDSKLMSNELFRGLNRDQFPNENLSVDKYACYLYSVTLSKLPAIVRKWWNGSHSRQKVFVDKLTTNFVSGLICQNELECIGSINMKDKQNNMQVTVHTSTREVIAVYFIDEARMELIITLAPNYPLGGVKVESGKQIGGRASSRNIAMQLTIFLTHQNGSIFDGLLLWKNNLDKKFEGVEECYVCYTVIHQDTCQLPKLTCKTCRKKFHSPCLYKWFTTSSKSTCPICRNRF